MAHPLSTYALTGLAPVESNWRNTSHLEAGATADADGFAGLLSLDNPLLVVGVLLGVTVGLIGVSGSVRIGRARASASIDKT